jgi:hypothetical protein
MAAATPAPIDLEALKRNATAEFKTKSEGVKLPKLVSRTFVNIRHCSACGIADGSGHVGGMLMGNYAVAVCEQKVCIDAGVAALTPAYIDELRLPYQYKSDVEYESESLTTGGMESGHVRGVRFSKSMGIPVVEFIGPVSIWCSTFEGVEKGRKGAVREIMSRVVYPDVYPEVLKKAFEQFVPSA